MHPFISEIRTTYINATLTFWLHPTYQESMVLSEFGNKQIYSKISCSSDQNPTTHYSRTEEILMQQPARQEMHVLMYRNLSVYCSSIPVRSDIGHDT